MRAGGGFVQKYRQTQYVDVSEYGINGGVDESDKIQRMIDILSDKGSNIFLKWGNKTYIFYGILISGFSYVEMMFDDTIWQLPNDRIWYRYRNNNSEGNYHIKYDNIPKIINTGKLTLDGVNNSFNHGDTYNGEGLASLIQIDGTYIYNASNPSYIKTKTGNWVITANGFTINQTSGSYTSARITFSRNPNYHYRVRFRLTINSGTVWYNRQSSTSNPTTDSGEYFYDIPATSGSTADQIFYWFSNTGTNAIVEVVSVDQIDPSFEDTYIKTNGTFVIKNHGFSTYSVTTQSEFPSYNSIELNDWTWINTPIGGHYLLGYFNSILLNNYYLNDRFGKSWYGFGDESARTFTIQAKTANKVSCWPNVIKITNIVADYIGIPGVFSARDITYENIRVNKFGRFVGADGIERNLGENDGTQYAILGPPGGQSFKFDLSYYNKDTKVSISNYASKDTSTYTSGGSRIWDDVWFQAGVKYAIISDSKFSSILNLQGKGDFDDMAQSWSFRQTVINCEFDENGTLSPAYGSRITNCYFTRTIPQRSTAVDYPFPTYSDQKLAVYLYSTHIEYDNTYGGGNNFDPVIFESCVFIARSFFPSLNQTKAYFNNCIFENGTHMTIGGSVNNYDYELKFINCKRLVVKHVSISDTTKKDGAILSFNDCEIIIDQYTGISDLDSPSSSIRKIIDHTTISWNNLKIYNSSGVLLHNLKGFEWLREPSGENDIGIEGAHYYTDSNIYEYKSNKWLIFTRNTA